MDHSLNFWTYLVTLPFRHIPLTFYRQFWSLLIRKHCYKKINLHSTIKIINCLKVIVNHWKSFSWGFKRGLILFSANNFSEILIFHLCFLLLLISHTDYNTYTPMYSLLSILSSTYILILRQWVVTYSFGTSRVKT